MELLRTELPATHRIALAGDVHFGNAAMHKRGFDSLLERLKKEDDLFVCLMGDLLEAIRVDDFRFEPHIHDGRQRPLVLAGMMGEKLYPVRHKVLTTLFGNHEYTNSRYGDLTKLICDTAKIPYGGYTTKLSVYDNGVSSDEPMYRMYLTHGRWGISSSADDPIRRESNMKLSLKRRLAPLASDCAIMGCGHTHRLIISKPVGELYLYEKDGQIESSYTKGIQHAQYIDPNHRWFVNTGAFLKNAIIGATTYSEFAGYAPIELGYSIVHVRSGVISNIEAVHLGVDHGGNS